MPWRMAICLGSLAQVSASRICFLRTSHLPSGESVATMCTRMASKMPMQSVCNRMDMASSSSVRAGYFALGIFVISSHGSLEEDAPPFLPGSVSRSEKWKLSQSGHHASTVAMSPLKLEMTVGRHTRPPPSTSIVLVTRSGIDISLLSPRPLSLRKPETIGRSRSSSHAAAHASAPSQPCAVMCSSSCAYIAGVKTVFTDTSRSPGSDTNDSMLSMSTA
mmetsp:Transcript_39900/g.79854  ORF Transcript_39900/g.79854 Transcript_39900/m.79854 type:complete len:219 (-) Transcript_39900:380-1036(-)